MARVAGADGCAGGWIVVTRDLTRGDLGLERVESLGQVLARSDAPDVLCVDVPIGLLDEAAPGGRECDRAARALLGGRRASSVFSPPVRATLAARSYEEACRANHASSSLGIRISRQCYGILAKIREVDELVTPVLQGRLIEVHPEVSFHELNGRRALEVGNKKKADGRRMRLELLESAWQCELGELLEHRPRPSERDDVLDAMVACWTAERVRSGVAVRLPATPVLDSRGLRMEIVR